MQEGPNQKVFEEIDESLRQAYEELLNEQLPQRFVDLLQRLKESERDKDGPGDAGDAS